MAYVTEQVRRVQKAMYAAGFKRSEFSAAVEREYKGVVAARKIYEYGRLALVVYTNRLDNPETACKLVESGEVNAELHLTYNKQSRDDSSYRLIMRFTASSAYRGKYRLYTYNALSPRIAEDERFTPFDSHTIDFDEFKRLWDNQAR